jgi:hypothetical protein
MGDETKVYVVSLRNNFDEYLDVVKGVYDNMQSARIAAAFWHEKTQITECEIESLFSDYDGLAPEREDDTYGSWRKRYDERQDELRKRYGEP